ncbi:MAG: biotin/lipoyl-containing protein, partial [Pseudomonadota bacterium]
MSIIEVTVPDIGDFTDVPVISIMVAPGDHVAEEDPLIELESDKATMEVPSPAVGDVKEIKVKEGDTVSEGSLIMTLEVVGAKAPVDAPSPAGIQEPEASAPAAATPAPSPAHATASTLAPIDEGGFKTSHASPSVRAFARELGVDLAKLTGSGRKGRILREDVTGVFKKEAAPAPAAAPAAGGMGIPPIPAVDFSKFGPIEDVEMSRIKKISGPALHRSWL